MAAATVLGGGGGLVALAAPSQAVPSQAEVTVDPVPRTSWSVDGRVYAVKIVGGTVYVGGSFSAAISPTGQRVARRNLAAFRLRDGALVTGWRSDTGAVVGSLDSDGRALWVGGSFGSIGGVARAWLAKVNLTTGGVDTAFDAGLDGAVLTIDVDGHDLYVGGEFTSSHGQTHARIAKLDALTGAPDGAFRASAGGTVRSLRKSPSSSVVFVAGRFASLSGENRVGIGGVSSTSGAVEGPAFASSTRPTIAVDVSADGTTVFAGAASNAITAWRATTGTTRWRTVADGDVQAVRYFDDTLYFGFHDGFRGDNAIKLLAADPDTGALDPRFRPRINRFHGVFAIDVSAAGVVIGGEFTRVSGVAARNWARMLPPAPPAPGPSLSASKYAKQIKTSTNRSRRAHRVSRLANKSCLKRAATRQATRMAARDRILPFKAAKYERVCRLRQIKKNVAVGFTNGKAVTRSWLRHPRERRRMLNSKVRVTGVAARRSASGEWYAIQVFGVRR